jgi:hypothetical protein
MQKKDAGFALTLREPRRQGFVALEGDVIETRGQRVPANLRGRLGSHNVRFGHHAHAAPAQRTVHEADFDFDWSSRLNALRVKKKHAARTDVCRAQHLLFLFALSRDE